jgi:hypothetical protein
MTSMDGVVRALKVFNLPTFSGKLGEDEMDFQEWKNKVQLAMDMAECSEVLVLEGLLEGASPELKVKAAAVKTALVAKTTGAAHALLKDLDAAAGWKLLLKEYQSDTVISQVTNVLALVNTRMSDLLIVARARDRARVQTPVGCSEEVIANFHLLNQSLSAS